MKLESINVDSFLSGALVTDSHRKILFASQYFEDELHWDLANLVGKSSDILFTHSSKIFCESYLVPILLSEKKCEEMQLALLDGNGKRVPIIINARIDEEGYTYWSFFSASKRDVLYQELLEARERLEKQSERLERLSSTDELTGLLNRRAFNGQADIILAQASRSQQPISAILIDVDHFKKINDSHGHIEGDRVLSELGKQLNDFGRMSDLVARYGGEEFLILLPDTDKVGAMNLAARLHELVANVRVKNRPLTVSIGVTSHTNNKVTLTTLYREADEALYLAKHNGRNRTEFHLAG